MIKIIIGCVALSALFVLSGKMLDMEGERAIHQLYPREKTGILTEMQDINHIQGHKKALLLLHGFQSSPVVWSDLILNIKKTPIDIYAPLLPFHGKNLESLRALNTDILETSIQNNILNLSKKYEQLTVVGFSLGGALMANIIQKNNLPKNVQVILYNPALFLKMNTVPRRLEIHLYTLWRNYCNYEFLGCAFPHYESGDAIAKAQINKTRSFQYDVVPAGLEVYNLDLKARTSLETMRRPYYLLISKDDNLIDYDKQKMACEKNNQFCQLYSFDSGKHIVHWGKNKKAFEKIIAYITGTVISPIQRADKSDHRESSE